MKVWRMNSLRGGVSMISVVILASVFLFGCGTKLPPLKTVAAVDIPRFMGDWYVIANIPTFIEKGAHNAVESYRLDADGTIATTFTFRKGAFDGPLKTYTPRGFILDTTGAVWGMRFIWPIKAEYLITSLVSGRREKERHHSLHTSFVEGGSYEQEAGNTDGGCSGADSCAHGTCSG